jgi:5'-nucleotidase
MGRGKDGYTSLLIEEEGGTAVEIVSEENGVLISTILRQYFMSLKVLGRWKHWGASLDRKFTGIQTRLQKDRSHGFTPASPTSPVDRAKMAFPLPRAEKQKDGGHETDSDDDDDAVYADETSRPITFTEREAYVLRRAMAKWWRLAGLKGSARLCDEEGDAVVNWTTGIAPRVEGRIKAVGGEVKM